MLLVQLHEHSYPIVHNLGDRHDIVGDRLVGLDLQIPWKKIRYAGLTHREKMQLEQHDKTKEYVPFEQECRKFEGHLLDRILDAPSNARDGKYPSMSMVMGSYIRLRDEGKLDASMTFQNFVSLTDLLSGVDHSSGSPHLGALAVDSAGVLLWIYMLGNRLKMEEITEDSVIERYKINPVRELLDLEMKKAEEELDRLRDLHKAIQTKSVFNNHELPNQLLSCRALNYARGR